MHKVLGRTRCQLGEARAWMTRPCSLACVSSHRSTVNARASKSVRGTQRLGDLNHHDSGLG
jgi:hypothetical protein